MEWKKSKNSNDFKSFVNDFIDELVFNNFIIVEVDDYWYTNTIINHVFDNLKDAQLIADKMNNEKNKFNGWDWIYHDDHNLIQDDDNNLIIEYVDNKTEKSYDELKKEIGCRYDGGHYLDIQYMPFAVDVSKQEIQFCRYKFTFWNKEEVMSGRHGYIRYLDFENPQELFYGIDFDVKCVEIEIENNFREYDTIENTEFGYCFPISNKNDNFIDIEKYIVNRYKKKENNF